ncbi:IPTL-CTERM sorting domain-containing protein [Rhodoferax sp.]|uniref:IPTL-CTERM sorting domain-containing protein n=1 Tax=Rhodoferax sp. TaxID=50421 RepID=UPI002605AF7F|nr:IPTL-CTERM sorting domain-containing protein [Rhodoferax sp.]MDD2919866.1 IPTL-CTERM sorting domain-containing protein [Rhodoferax sp.]
MRKFLKSSLLRFFAVVFLISSFAAAAQAQIFFVPSNDPTGHVFSTNTNDGWSSSRGVVFQATATQTITGIGLYQDLTGVLVNYEVAQTTGASGDISVGKTVLRSGSNTFTTTGLQYITFPITPLQLMAGNFYHVRFDFAGNSNQNFFYDNDNVAFSQSGFAQIDGTQGDDTGNSVMPRIQLLQAAAAPMPIPTLSESMLVALALLLAGGSFVALRRRPS